MNKLHIADKEKNAIAYCGLYCGNCFAHTGAIADLARDLRKELRQSRFDIMAEPFPKCLFFAPIRIIPNAMKSSALW